MKGLQRQAALVFLAPLLGVLAIGLPYVVSGRFVRALHGEITWVDLVVWVCIGMIMMLPPLLGYRVMVRVAGSLSESSEVVRRVAEGDFSRTLAAWAAEHSELFDLEQGINATALRLRDRLIELGEEKARLEAILANMAEGVLLMDAQKRILMVNPAAEAMFGRPAEDVIGRDHLEITHHFDLDQRLDRVLSSGEPELLEIKRARPEEQILECRLAPAGAGLKEQRGLLLVLRDITRPRRLEQMRTEFVSNVTHELRTPLTSIGGFAETLLEGALDDPDTARHFVGIIKKESEHLSRLIEDILDLSRIESGKWKMQKAPVDLGALTQETSGRLRSKAENLGVHLEVIVPADIPTIPGDPHRLAQVLINLIDNALKYTPAGGKVTVSAEDEPQHVKLVISDTGTGMPKADLPRIFERFYRVDKARTRSTGGTGLGLSIVKHIVDAHGGTISVVSDVGQGATFTITIPKS